MIEVRRQQSPELVGRAMWQADIAMRRGIGGLAADNLRPPMSIVDAELQFPAYDVLKKEVMRDPAAGLVRRYIDESERQTSSERTDPASDGMPEDVRAGIMNHPIVRAYIASRDMSAAHEVLRKNWSGFATTYKSGVQDGVAQGYIPAEVMQRLEPAFRYTAIRIIDSAIARFQGERFKAFYENTLDNIGFRHDSVDALQTFRDYIAHELTHKISGGTFVQTAPVGPRLRTRVGYSSEIRPDVMTRVGFNEAANHQATLGILTGDFETFDPDKRRDEDRLYYGYRKTVATFSERSGGLVTSRDITNGLFEDTGTSGNIGRRKHLVRQAVAAYGLGALANLEQLCLASTKIPESELHEAVLGCIYPPRLNRTGDVVALGVIDPGRLPTAQEVSCPE